MIVLKSDWFRNHLSSPCTTSPRTDFETHLGVNIKLPLGAVFNFTNGPPPVEKIGIDEFPLLEKNTYKQNKCTQKHKFLAI